MVRDAPSAGGLQADERRPLATLTPDLDFLGTPLVDLAQLHVVNFVASFGMSDHRRQPVLLSLSPVLCHLGCFILEIEGCKPATHSSLGLCVILC